MTKLNASFSSLNVTPRLFAMLLSGTNTLGLTLHTVEFVNYFIWCLRVQSLFWLWREKRVDRDKWRAEKNEWNSYSLSMWRVLKNNRKQWGFWNMNFFVQWYFGTKKHNWGYKIWAVREKVISPCLLHFVQINKVHTHFGIHCLHLCLYAEIIS